MSSEDESKRFIIITGMSGAGKTLVMQSFEDSDYYCADNIPPALVPKFAELCRTAGINKLAIVLDIRARQFFNDLDSLLEQLPQYGVTPFIVFLEASDSVLLKRYNETRRAHPLSPDGRVSVGLEKERQLLRKLRKRANCVIDTTELNRHELRASVFDKIDETGSNFTVSVVSFGFKYGVPQDTDMIFDCRFLPNPYYLPELQPLTGLDAPVRDYVFSFEATHEYVQKISDMLLFMLPKVAESGRRRLIVGVGCTGGHHRSTAIAEKTAAILRDNNWQVNVEHRDIDHIPHNKGEAQH